MLCNQHPFYTYPPYRVHIAQAKYQETDVFKIEETKQILVASLSKPINIRLLIETVLFTGMRRGEIVGIKWSDINFKKQLLSIKRSIYKLHGEKPQEKEPKSHSRFRTISIPNCLCNTLLEYKDIQDVTMPSEYVFTTKDGDVMNPHTPTKQFSIFLDRHGIRHIKFHCLRHTSATILLANGCDIKTVSARLGHSSIETTDIYVHMFENVDRQAAITFEHLHIYDENL